MYKQITYDERCNIAYLRSKHKSIRYIARELKRSPSTISREVRRNKSAQGTYTVRIAQEKSNGRRSRSRKKLQYNTEDWFYVSELIRTYWSPEQASLVLGLMNIVYISNQTIYKYIKRDRKQGGNLWTYLRHSNKRRRKGYGKPDSRGVLDGKRELDERPDGCQNRSEIGHFEIDLVHGTEHTDCILTLVDRKTRFTIIQKLPNKSKKIVARSLIKIGRRFNIKSFSADNGTEWHDYKVVERRTNIPFYFAKPYHSWERGTNENTNGLIRQFIPKRQTMKYLSQKECNDIANKINRRPRKILNLSTPEYCHLGIPTVLPF